MSFNVVIQFARAGLLLNRTRILHLNRFASLNAGVILAELSKEFEAAQIPEPGVSALHLVAKVMNIKSPSEACSSAARQELTAEQLFSLHQMKLCRLSRMPVQYIVGDWDFRQLTLKMRPPIFIPRPETEELVDLVIKHLRTLLRRDTVEILRVLEIGCGSGAICLSILKEMQPETRKMLQVVAVDHSTAACKLTLENALHLGLLNGDNLRVINCKISDEPDSCYGLGEVLDQPQDFDVIISNPPYVLRKDMAVLSPEIKLYEDLRALDGGKDGLEIIALILRLGSATLKSNSLIFLEVDPCHPFLVPQLLKKFDLTDRLKMRSVVKDFNGKERFIVVERC